jgi:hypothetical protein
MLRDKPFQYRKRRKDGKEELWKVVRVKPALLEMLEGWKQMPDWCCGLDGNRWNEESLLDLRL